MVALVSHAFLDMESVIRVSSKITNNQEESILRILNGRHAPKFLGSWEHGELTALRRAYIPGRTLFELLSTHQIPYREPELLALLCQIVEAVMLFHAEGIYHRDIKPENIVLGYDQQIYFIDWGAGLLWDGTKPPPRFRAGTLQYAAPEVLAETPYHPGLADIWSLGALFYVLASGCFPFSGASPEAVLIDIVSKQATELHLESFVFLRTLVKGILVSEPAKRFTLKELLTLMNERIDRRAHSLPAFPSTFVGYLPVQSHSEPLPPVSRLLQERRKGHKGSKGSGRRSSKTKKRTKSRKAIEGSVSPTPKAKRTSRRKNRGRESTDDLPEDQTTSGPALQEICTPKQPTVGHDKPTPKPRTRAALSPSLYRFDFAAGHDVRRLTQAGISSSEPLYLAPALSLPSIPQSLSNPPATPLSPKRRSRSTISQSSSSNPDQLCYSVP